MDAICIPEYYPRNIRVPQMNRRPLMDVSSNGNNDHKPQPTASSEPLMPRSALEQAPCPHCLATGTCTRGPELTACSDCIDRVSARMWQRFKVRQLSASKEQPGCWCGVCLGKGRIEGATFKFLRFFPFIFAAAFVAGCFLVLLLAGKETSEKLQGALTTLMGTIVGFYFGGKRSDS
jgi:hypothetical protein